MAKVNFIRRHTDVEVDEEPIVDGNFIVTGDGNIYIDYGLERIKIVGGGGGNATGDTLPIGSITAYGKETAPANWLICDGSAVSRTSYADLFAVIGTKYGEGDGSTTFNLPNLKGRVPVGLDSSDTDFNTIGKTGGEKTHKLTIEELAEHAHDIHGNTNTYSASGVNYYQTSSIFAGYAAGDQKILFYNGFGAEKTGGNQPHNNLQPYEVNNFIIKAFQSAGVVAEVVNTQTESDTNTYSCNYINGIIESGNNSNGNWIKYTDGTMICTRTIAATIDCTNSWGTLYYGQNNDKYNFAQSFIEPPILNLQYSTSEAISFIPIVYSGIVIDNDGFKRIEIARPNSVANVYVKVYVIAIGKWK